MKALLFARYGDPSVLEIADVPAPHPGPGQIRIAVRTAGVSPGDVALRSGAWRDRAPLRLPYVVGVEAAGVVDEIGAGVEGVEPVEGVELGDEVFGLRALGGATAAYALLDAWAPRPQTMTWDQAGGAAAAIETSVRALDAVAAGPGTTLLVDGASGGVGSVLVQLAVARGVRVLGTASPANHEFLAGLGAHPLTYGPGLTARVTEHVDAAVDVAGQGGLPDLLTLTGRTASVVTLVDPAAASLGVRLTRYDPQADHRAALTAGSGVTVHVTAVYPWTAAAEAHTRVASGHTRGKVVLRITA
jgi:NADPH:quinone reductase-like Zn-dependent oxidoreductase